MAGSIIKIKRSKVKGAPGTLEYGELAYSGKADTQKLFIGMYGDGAQSETVLVTPIGGKFYTDLLDVTPGSLTNNKAVVVGSNGKINQFLVDDIELNDNVITTSTSNTNLKLNANGSGKIEFYEGTGYSYTFPRLRGDQGKVLTMGTGGHTEWASVAVDLNMNADQGTDTTLNLLTGTLKFRGLDGIYTVFNNDTLQIFGRQATTTQMGVASFDATDFDVDTSAHVSIKRESIQDIVGKMFTDSIAALDGGTGTTNLNSNITVTYSDGSGTLGEGRIELDVNTATTDSAGVARFNSDFFSFGSGENTDKVSLVGTILKSITLPTIVGQANTAVISTNSLSFAVGAGISITGTGGNTITFSGVDATDTVKGIAKFPSTQFDMSTTGSVAIRKATTNSIDIAEENQYFGVSKYDSAFFSVTAGVVSSNDITIGDVTFNLGDNETNESAIADLTGLTSLEITSSGSGGLKLSGSTIEQKITDFDLVLKPLGTVSGRNASIKIDNGTPNSYWVLPSTRGTGDADNEVLTINKTSGLATWQAPNQNVAISSDAQSPNATKTLTVGRGSLKFTGSQGIKTSVSKSEDTQTGEVLLTIEGQLATTSVVGVAKFSDTSFAVSASTGEVTIKADGITNAQIVHDYLSIGSTSISLGGSSSNLQGLNSIAFAGLTIGGSTLAGATPDDQEQRTITATGSNKHLYLSGSASGTTGKVKISDAYFLPRVNATAANQVLLGDIETGEAYWGNQAVILKLSADDYDPALEAPLSDHGEYNLLTDGNLSFLGAQGIKTYFDNASNEFTFEGQLATDEDVGVAKFDATEFVVDEYGSVTLATGGIDNTKLETPTIQIGTYSETTTGGLQANPPTELGTTITILKNMTGITTGDLRIGTTAASSTIENVTSSTNGGIIFKTKGEGDITFFSGTAYSYSLPRSVGEENYVLTTNGSGSTSWAKPVSTLTITDERATPPGTPRAEAIDLNSGKLLFKDGVGTTATIGADSITINGVIANGGEDGDETILGVASYEPTQFAVSNAGVVTLVDEGVQEIVGAMLNLTGTSPTLTHENITVAYEDQGDGAGKLTFKVPYATSSIEGVASFTEGDFTVGTDANAGIVSLGGTVVKGISTNGTSVTPSSNSFAIEGDGAIETTGGTGDNTDVLTITVKTATASTMGVAYFPTGNSGDFILGDAEVNPADEGKVSLRKATYSTSGVAKFASSQFSIDELPADGSPNAETGNGSVTIRPIKIGGQTITNGNDTPVTEFTGLTSVAIGSLVLATNSITATGVSSNISIGLAPKGTGSVALGGKKITNLANPTDASDAANKEYVDSKASGLTVKDPVRLATGPSVAGLPNANGVDSIGKITLTYTVSTASTASYPVIDGTRLDINDRVLVKNQGPHSGEAAFADGTDDAENGIYIWKDTAGTAGWARAADADISGDFTGATFVFIQEGEKWADTGWVLQTDWDPLTSDLDTDPLKFVQFSAAGVLKPASDGGLYKSGGYFGIKFEEDYVGLIIDASNNLVLGDNVAGAGLDIANHGILSVSVDGTTIDIDDDGKVVISANYTGQATISTVGTITEGTWEADPVGAAYGGTGQSTVNKGDLLIGNTIPGTGGGGPVPVWDVIAMNGLTNTGKVLQVVNNGTVGSPSYAVEYGDIDGGEY